MKVNRQHKLKARILWDDSFVDGLPDFSVIAEKIGELRREKSRHKEFILEALLDRIRIYLREHRLRIISPGELDKRDRENVLSAAGPNSGYAGGIEFISRPSLIAGLRIEKGYEISDYSVEKELCTIRNMFRNN